MAGDKRSARLGVLGVVSLLLLGTLGTRLWFMQVVDAQAAQSRVTENRTRTVTLLPERGRIFDRDGRIVADNRRVLQVAVDWAVIENDADRQELFTRLSGVLGQSLEELEARYDSKVPSRLLPLVLADEVDEPQAQYISERIEDYPGVTIQLGWERQYPYAPLAAHVVGYMGAVTSEQLEHYEALGYNQNERIGQFGVERSFESVLRGVPGYVTYEVRASGAIVREIARVEPITGQDVELSIDLDLQQLAEQALQTQLAMRRLVTVDQLKDEGKPIKPKFPESGAFKAQAGSVIVENHMTGEILAMASYPTFDNRWFNSDVSGEKLAEIFPTYQLDGNGQPLIGPDGEKIPLDPGDATLVNRAIQGQYNVGSTFKPFVAWTALTSPGDVLPGGANYVFQDRGGYKLESIDDWTCAQGVKCEFRNSIDAQGIPSQYGDVTLEDALAVSSDAYFYRIGELIFTRNGYQPVLQEGLRQFSFGSKTGIDLPYEYSGRVPDKASKQELYDKGVLHESEEPNYLVGDNVQLSIGQGLLSVTPMQLATAYSTIANGGYVLRPHIASAILAPGTPDSETTAGFADLSQKTVVRSFADPETVRQLNMDQGAIRGPIIAGLRRVITGPGVEYPRGRPRSPTGEKVFGHGLYDYDALPIAGKTGTAQGAASLPWNDSSAFTGFSLDDSRPYTVTAYLEKAGYGAQAAAPVAKCIFQSFQGIVPLDPVQLSDPLDITQTVAAQPTYLPDGGKCLEVQQSAADRELRD